MHEGHRDRLKSRYLAEGLNHFEHHNMLELLLFYSIARRDTNEIAHNLMNTFGSISGVFDAPVEELCKVDGIGKSAAILISLIPAISRVYAIDKNSDISAINSVEKAGEFFMPQFIGVTEEEVKVALLDGKCRILHCCTLSEGNVNRVGIDVRKLVEVAMRYKAVSVILCHNHPNGIAIPSEDDVETTWKVRRALDFVDIKLVDHIIVADDDFVSMRESSRYAHTFSDPNFDTEG